MIFIFGVKLEFWWYVPARRVKRDNSFDDNFFQCTMKLENTVDYIFSGHREEWQISSSVFFQWLWSDWWFVTVYQPINDYLKVKHDLGA